MSETRLGQWTWRKAEDGTWISAEIKSGYPGDAHHSSPLGMALTRIEELEELLRMVRYYASEKTSDE